MKKVLFVAVCAAWLGFACSTSKVKVDELRVELRENPVGVGTAHPRFMWQIESEKSNVNQVAYQIQVAASAQELEKGKNLLWDSGFVNSDTSLFIAYGGSPLQSATEYFWRVRVKTNKGRTAWSETENFATALLDSAAWKAEWIGIAGATNPRGTWRFDFQKGDTHPFGSSLPAQRISCKGGCETCCTLHLSRWVGQELPERRADYRGCLRVDADTCPGDDVLQLV